MEKIIIGVLLATALAPAYSADEVFYVGANLGQARASGTLSGGASSATDTSFSVLGGYQINKIWAAELQYVDLGRIAYSGSTTTATSTALALSALGMWPIDNNFSVFGKAGLAYSTTTSGRPQDTNRIGIAIGFGGQYNMSNVLGIRAGYDRYEVGKSSDGNDGNYGVISAGLVYKF
ncbi:MAG: porin family protein [Pseudomonadota bacterium]